MLLFFSGTGIITTSNLHMSQSLQNYERSQYIKEMTLYAPGSVDQVIQLIIHVHPQLRSRRWLIIQFFFHQYQ